MNTDGLLIADEDELVKLAVAEFETSAEITLAEKKFLQSVHLGKICDFTAAHYSTHEHTISAELIAWICTHKLATAMVTHRGIRVRGAVISKKLRLHAAQIEFALIFTRCEFVDEIDLSRAKLPMLGFEGSILSGINATGIDVQGYLLMRDIVIDEVLYPFQSAKAVRLFGATIGKSLECTGAIFKSTAILRPALDCNNARIEGSALLNRDFKAEGEVTFRNAYIGGDLDFDGGKIENPNAVALVTNGSRIAGSAFLRSRQFSLPSSRMRTFQCTVKGEIQMIGTRIDGDLDFGGAILSEPRFDEKSNQRVALNVNRGQIGNAVFLRSGFRAEGCVTFRSASIENEFECADASFLAVENLALDCLGLTIGRSAHLKRLIVKGEVTFRGARVENIFTWDGDFDAHNESALGRLDLRLARIGTLAIDQRVEENQADVLLDGLLFDSIDETSMRVDTKTRLAWIRRQPHFSAQPYEQLAAILSKSGHATQAKDLLYEKERVRYRSVNWRFPSHECFERLIHSILGLAIGWGYRPARAFWISAVLILIGVFVFNSAHTHGWMIQADAIRPASVEWTENSIRWARSSQQIRSFNPIIYSFSVYVPVVNAKEREAWAFDSKSFGGYWMGWYSLFHMLCGWILTPLWLAGLSGLIRK